MKPQYMTPEDGKRYPDWVLNDHVYVPGRPHVPHPEWADALGIPAHCNRGVFVRTVPVEIAKAVLMTANHENRPLNDNRIRPIRLALENGTYREDHVDGLCWDWNWITMNAKKRLSASVEANLPITLRIEYGIDPALRPYIDAAEWRKYCDRWTFVIDHEDNKLINNMLSLHFKLYSGMGTGSYSHDDAMRAWEAIGPSLRWVAALVRRNRLEVCPQKITSSQNVSSYYALAQMHKRDKKVAMNFANEIYAIPQEESAGAVPCQQAVAYRVWLMRQNRKQNIVDQKIQYELTVYFMRRALDGEPIKYNADERLKTKRGEVEPGVAIPQPSPTQWLGTTVEYRVAPVGKEVIGKYLQKKAKLNCVEAIIGAVSLLNREGIGAQQIKELVLAERVRWSLATNVGGKLYRAIRSVERKKFSPAVCAAFCYKNISANDTAGAEAFLARVTKLEFLRAVVRSLESIRTIYGFKSRVGRALALEALEALAGGVSSEERAA